MAGLLLLIAYGLVCILCGVLAFIWPGVSVTTIVLLLGAYALVDGIATIAHRIGLRV